MPERRTTWRRRRALSTSTAAFAFVVLLMVALIAYATSISGSVSVGPCIGAGSTSSASDAIKIGFVTELSGPAVSDGYGARVAAELAVNETNASGGIDGRPVDLVVVDSRTNPQEAAKCAAALDQQGVVAITGATDLGDAQAVQAYAEANGVPFVVSAISSASLSPPGSNWTVSVQPDAVQWGAALAKYVSEAVPGAKIALMTQNAEQQREMSQGVRWYASTFKNDTVVFDQLYANAQFPWATAAAAAKLSGANAVVVSWLPTVGFSESNVVEALQSAGFLPSQIFVASATNQISDLGVGAAGIRGGALFDGAMARGYPNASAFANELQPFVNGELNSPDYCGVCPTEVGPLYYYTNLGMKMMINAVLEVLSGGHALTRADFMSSMKQASIQDAFGNTLTIGASGSSVGHYYIVAAGPLNETSSTYPLQLVSTIEFAPGTIPAYTLSKTA
ncbi:MAG TPA: ABC transporter substrate-binding protein [Nitrososphaerales archaeon]|nr:ABC transporter substrate-binding protein [Nitrososphaerales archaeon]